MRSSPRPGRGSGGFRSRARHRAISGCWRRGGFAARIQSLTNRRKRMRTRAYTLLMAALALPPVVAAQARTAAAAPAAASANPVADALRAMEQRFSRILIAAAEAMPADKYSYRPTPAQMSFAQIQAHLANEGNDLLCSKVAGVPAPQRAAVDTTAGKDQLVARLKDTFQFCETAFAHLDDSKLNEPIQLV